MYVPTIFVYKLSQIVLGFDGRKWPSDTYIQLCVGLFKILSDLKPNSKMKSLEKMNLFQKLEGKCWT